jgi:hypothetical protein
MSSAVNRPAADRVSFDEQAGVFEGRAGLPDGVPERIAEAVRRYTGAGPGDLIVDIGAGTGLIGQFLALPPTRYLGLDNSQPMLDEFAPRLPQRDRDARLLLADADEPWPVPDRSARVIFGSRVFQLLECRHVVREASRVTHPDGAVLVHGKVARSPDAPHTLARRHLHHLLSARGFTARPVGRLLQRLFAHAQAAGGIPLPPLTVASWRRQVRPADVPAKWRQKRSMGGITPPPEVGAAILTELTTWLTETYGDPTEPVATHESYVLTGVRLHPPKEMT